MVVDEIVSLIDFVLRDYTLVHGQADFFGNQSHFLVEFLLQNLFLGNIILAFLPELFHTLFHSLVNSSEHFGWVFVYHHDFDFHFWLGKV